MSRLAQMVNQIRGIKKQLAGRIEFWKEDAKTEPLCKAAQELTGKLDALEAKMHNPKAEVTYDILAQKGGAKLYSQLGVVLEYVKDSDGPPTQGMQTMATDLFRELQQYDADFAVLVSNDLAKLNEAAKKL